MTMLRLVLAAPALLLSVAAVAAQTAVETLAVDGTCERLVIAGEDLSKQCGTALVQILDNGAVDVYVGAGGQGLFDLAGPERMVIFRGRVAASHSAWTDHAVDVVLLGTRSNDTVDMVDVSGNCTYQDPADGIARIACEASDRLGRTYSLDYTTDGLPPVSF